MFLTLQDCVDNKPPKLMNEKVSNISPKLKLSRVLPKTTSAEMIGLPAQFVTQTMVKGDRVTLMTTGGATVVTGVVESISLLYTTIRNDAFVPISIPNKVCGCFRASRTCHRAAAASVQVPPPSASRCADLQALLDWDACRLSKLYRSYVSAWHHSFALTASVLAIREAQLPPYSLLSRAGSKHQ